MRLIKQLKRNGFKNNLPTKMTGSYPDFLKGKCRCDACEFSCITITESVKCKLFNFIPLHPYNSVCNIFGSGINND